MFKMVEIKPFSVFMLLIFQIGIIESVPTSRILTKRAVSLSDHEKWDSNYIQYELDPKLHRHKCLIQTAMFHITLQSCVIFQPKWRDGEIEFLKIEKSTTSCWANVGKPQFITHQYFYRKWNDPIYVPSSKMNLADTCISFGSILHELMHMLGFTHEHQRSDRDQFIKINLENIEDFDDRDFVKNQKENEIIYTEFDIDSITMYGPTKAQSADPERLKTIESRVHGKKIVAAEDKTGLSALDVKAINDLYNCYEKVKSNEGFIWDKWNRFQTYVHDCRTEADKYLNRTLVYAFKREFASINKKN